MTEQPSTDESIQDEQFVEKVITTFDNLPLGLKHLAIQGDILMVMKGLKAGTDLFFRGESYQEDEFRILQEVFAGMGLRIEMLKIHPDTLDERYLRREGVIYKPVTLADQTASSTLVPPYDTKSTVGNYIQMATASGYPEAAVAGKFYSFPESAIRDYLGVQSSQQRVTIAGYNEAYWYYPPAKQDLLDREARKDKFFAALGRSAKLSELYNGDTLKKSRELWSQRLPPRITKP